MRKLIVRDELDFCRHQIESEIISPILVRWSSCWSWNLLKFRISSYVSQPPPNWVRNLSSYPFFSCSRDWGGVPTDPEICSNFGIHPIKWRSRQQNGTEFLTHLHHHSPPQDAVDADIFEGGIPIGRYVIYILKICSEKFRVSYILEIWWYTVSQT